MRTWMPVWALLLLLGMPSVASAYIAMEPIRRILASAAPAVRACVVAHGLPAGRYSMHVSIDGSGKPDAVELRETPAPLTPAGQACLISAFRALQFPALDGPPPPPSTRRVHGRLVRVPGPSPRHVGAVRIVWPFVIAASAPP